MATLEQIQATLAAQIATRLSSIDDLQASGLYIPNPTPPAIDVFPDEEFQLPLGMGKGNNQIFLTVRVRTGTVDNEGGQRLLLSMMDPESSTSVGQAILYDRTLGGTVGSLNVSKGPSGFGLFEDAGGLKNLLGCTWTVQVIR